LRTTTLQLSQVRIYTSSTLAPVAQVCAHCKDCILVDQDDTFGSNTAPYYPVSPLSPQHLHQIEHLGKTTAVDHKDLLGLFSMAEEAMAFIAAKIFNFDDHGIHVPYQKPTPGAIEDLMRPDDKEEEEQISHQRSTPLALEILSQPHDGYDPYVTHLRGSKTYLESDPPRQALITHPDITVPPAPVSGGRSVPAGQVTVGLTLLVNGKTFPKIEGGQERWYTQRPGHGNNYSRYSDLVRHDKAKGLTPLPKASKAELATARHQQTFG
ncbi:hypothetical protein KCU62_g1606, partial [Aureobasidium sp. EXF-3399]